MFVSKLADSDAEATETQVWLDFARDCGYLSAEHRNDLVARYEEIGRMLHAMIEHPERFVPSFPTDVARQRPASSRPPATAA
jgi:hypothetical protein